MTRYGLLTLGVLLGYSHVGAAQTPIPVEILWDPAPAVTADPLHSGYEAGVATTPGGGFSWYLAPRNVTAWAIQLPPGTYELAVRTCAPLSVCGEFVRVPATVATTAPPPPPSTDPPPTSPPPAQPPPPTPEGCLEVPSGTDALGHVWTLGAGGWTLRDGAYSLPGGGALPGANGSAYVFPAGVAHVKDSRDLQWYRWEDPQLTWTLVGSTVPACSVGPPPPPPPPPGLPAPLIAGALATCRYTLTAVASPDGTTGWGAQFRRNGTNVGTRDSSPPYARTDTRAVGVYTWDIVWTKSGQPTQTSLPVVTRTCPIPGP